MYKKILAGLAWLPIAPLQNAWACAVCFGGADSNLRRGFTWGVLILGSLPFLMIAGFVVSIIRASRKHKAAL